jgi:BON domain-containing protein
MKKLCLVLCSSALCLLASSWSLSAGPLTMSHRQAKYSDAEIEATIKVKLAKSKIGKDGFQVHIKDGVATWTGSTTVIQHKGAATRMAKTAGAIQVVNNIKISGESGFSGKGNAAGQPRHVQVKASNPDKEP